MESNEKTLIGTVGYHILGNHSIGPKLLPQLRAQTFQGNVEVDELNWGPVAIVQRFQAEEPPIQRVIILCAIERSHRKIGDVTVFEWKGGLPGKAQIQACIGDAATGVISVENLLVIGEYFKIWNQVFLVDVEPGEEIAGEELTAEMQEQIPEIIQVIRQLVARDISTLTRVEYLYGDQIFMDVSN